MPSNYLWNIMVTLTIPHDTTVRIFDTATD